MNDISFSVATTASDQATWNGSNTVNGGSYAMQSTPYAEYLSLPFKLEPGTSTTNNTINTSNQQYQTVTTTQQYNTTTTTSNSNHYNIHYNNAVHNFIPTVTNNTAGRINGNHVIPNQMTMVQEQQAPTIKQEPNSLNNMSCSDMVMYEKDKRTSKYKCDVCDKNFAKKPTLKLHMRTHTGERPYHCQVCGKSFTQKQSVKIHMRIHTGEKPFKCATCDYTARTKGNLDNHMRKHTGERPFICKLCQKSYTQKSSLNTHIKTVHSETNGQLSLGPVKKDNKERPYQCTICNKRYTQKSSLNTHMKSSHNMETGGQIHQQTSLGNQLIQSNEKILVQPQMGNQEQWHQVQSVNNNIIGQEQQLVSGLMNQQYRQQLSYPNHIMKTERNESETNKESGSIRSAESPVVSEDKQLDPSEVVNVAPPVSQMLTPQSSCSSGYPSPAALQQQQFTQSSSPNESSHSPHNQQPDLQQVQQQQVQQQQQQVAATQQQQQQPDEARTNGLLHSFSMTPIHLHSL